MSHVHLAMTRKLESHFLFIHLFSLEYKEHTLHKIIINKQNMCEQLTEYGPILLFQNSKSHCSVLDVKD